MHGVTVSYLTPAEHTMWQSNYTVNHSGFDRFTSPFILLYSYDLHFPSLFMHYDLLLWRFPIISLQYAVKTFFSWLERLQFHHWGCYLSLCSLGVWPTTTLKPCPKMSSVAWRLWPKCELRVTFSHDTLLGNRTLSNQLNSLFLDWLIHSGTCFVAGIYRIQ